MSNIVYQVRNLQDEWVESGEDIFNTASPSRRRKLQILPTVEVYAKLWENRQGQAYFSLDIRQENKILATYQDGPIYSGAQWDRAVAMLQDLGLIGPTDSRCATIVLADNNIFYSSETVRKKAYL